MDVAGELIVLGFTMDDAKRAKMHLLLKQEKDSLENALEALLTDGSPSSQSKRSCGRCQGEYSSANDLALHCRKRHLNRALIQTKSSFLSCSNGDDAPNRRPTNRSGYDEAAGEPALANSKRANERGKESEYDSVPDNLKPNDAEYNVVPDTSAFMVELRHSARMEAAACGYGEVCWNLACRNVDLELQVPADVLSRSSSGTRSNG
jgi:hypothetical protein